MASPHTNTVLIICGPTATGKTALAIEVAKRLNTEIISADSRQCYRELNIGVAKPLPEELAAVPHYFIGTHSIQDNVNAAVFEQYALAAANHIFSRNRVAVMVGGTGLYIKAFTGGLDEIPEIDEAIKTEVLKKYEEHGLEYLQTELQKNDPLFWQEAEQQNPHRLMRALQVKLSTGRSITTFRTGQVQPRDFNTITIGLDLPRSELNARINERVDKMMRQGLLAEVEELLPHRHLQALQTVGYRELFPVINGKIALEQAVDAVKQRTRQYAKRQLTWFRRVDNIRWFQPTEASLADQLAEML